MLSVGLCVQLACVWEATARKPGNVHRYRDFDDVRYLDFLLSAAAIAPVLEGAAARPVGQTILEAIRLANPGGLGRVSQQDVHDEPTQGLREVMALAADRDLIARQYVNVGSPWIAARSLSK